MSTDENFRPFVLLLLNDEDKRAGGLVAYASWDWLVIDSLAVDEALRGKGWGRALGEEAERIGLSMGCTRATIETHSAESFYKSLGYDVVSRLTDYPPVRSFVRMNRSLTAAERQQDAQARRDQAGAERSERTFDGLEQDRQARDRATERSREFDAWRNSDRARGGRRSGGRGSRGGRGRR
ncbi:MAG: GNAT family N-acetyltransferase [Maricaulaceae bacterium]